MYAIVDLETTGGDAAVNRITEIAILVHDGSKLVDQFSTLINPQEPIPPFITELTGITNNMVENAPTFADIAGRVLELTEEKVFVAHNVRFDYACLKEEFRRIGLTFRRRQLCTVRLSRRILPGIASYSLGNLCQHVNIAIEGRHRALGDATATLKLFELLLSQDCQEAIKKCLKPAAHELFLSPYISMEQIEDVPDETGVYYLHDEKGDVLFVGHSRNIQKRILNHFLNASKSPAQVNLKESIRSVSYELTGSELIASLLEIHEIAELKPPYNLSQRRKVYSYGLYVDSAADSYTRIGIERFRGNPKTPRFVFPDNKVATDALSEMARQFNLCRTFCGLENEHDGCFSDPGSLCLGACRGNEPPESYNERLDEALKSFAYADRNFLIVSRGRYAGESSLVCIEDGHYAGFGYADQNLALKDISAVQSLIKPYPETAEVIRLIRDHLRKNRRDRIITR